MKPSTIIAALAPLQLTASQLQHQLPLADANILRNEPNSSIAISSDPNLSQHAPDTSNTLLAPALPFADRFLASSKAPPATALASLHWGGTGCPTPHSLYAEVGNGSVAAAAFSYYTPRFSVVAGERDAAPAESRRQCTVTFGLRFAAGWQVSLGGAESKGYVGYAGGSGALVEGSYWFVGVTGTERWSSRLQPPLHEEWMLGYKPNDDKGLWSACVDKDGEDSASADEAQTSASLSVQMSVYLPASSDPGVFLLEWTNVYLRWRSCDDAKVKLEGEDIVEDEDKNE